MKRKNRRLLISSLSACANIECDTPTEPEVHSAHRCVVRAYVPYLVKKPDSDESNGRSF